THTHTHTPVYKSLHWLPVSFIIDIKILLLVYKSLHSHAPEYMSDMLSRYTPSRSLRSSGTEHLTVPKARTKRHGEAAFSFYASSLWNTLPVNLRMADTVETFKRALQTHLFDTHTHTHTHTHSHTEWLTVETFKRTKDTRGIRRTYGQ